MFTLTRNGWPIGLAGTLLMVWVGTLGERSALAVDEEDQEDRIEVKFEANEQDILTKQAVEKLDLTIESLKYSDAPMRDVIRMLGEQLDINFIFDDDDISGNVTMRLTNVRLRDALNSILTIRKLAIIADPSGIFRIVPQERIGRALIETRTEVIQLNWINAEDVKRSMEPFLSDDVGKIAFNEESNVLILTDVPPQIEVIRGLIQQIDVPERQVEIEARLVDVNIGALRTLGTEWGVSKLNKDALTRRRSVTREFGQTLNTGVGATEENPSGTRLDDTVLERVLEETFLGGSMIGSSEVLSDVINGGIVESVQNPALALAQVLREGFSFNGGGELAFGDTINIFGDAYDLNAAFNALEERNVVEILANPRVTTLNNVPANLGIIEKIPYSEAVQGPSSGTVTEEIEFERAGVDIQVRPIITPNGFVRLEVNLQQMIFRGRVGPDDLDPPLIDVRRALTNVIVPDGNTVVLGGLRQLRKLESISATPWLHRIPLLGWLFKNKLHEQSKIELVLMMTPNIIKNTVALTDREKYWYDQIDVDWHLPDYFLDDVHNITD